MSAGSAGTRAKAEASTGPVSAATGESMGTTMQPEEGEGTATTAPRGHTAPALLDALVVAENALAVQGSYRAPDQRRIQHAHAVVRAAIAKARGR